MRSEKSYKEASAAMLKSEAIFFRAVTKAYADYDKALALIGYAKALAAVVKAREKRDATTDAAEDAFIARMEKQRKKIKGGL